MSFYNYLKNFDQVSGWCSPTTAFLSHGIMRHQIMRGVVGNAVEIGVHHGKYIIALACGLAPGEKAVAFDLFEDQHENIDGSGFGDRHIFEKNFRNYVDSSCLVCVKANSLSLSFEDIKKYGNTRFFSIDGGHTERITNNDLRLAERAIAPGGVVALDDILSHHWTGVISGFVRYLNEGGTLRPFALVPNKLLLCAEADGPSYRVFMREEFDDFLDKKNLEMFGSEIDCFCDRPEILDALENIHGIVELRREIINLKKEISDIKASRRFRLGSFMAKIIGR